MASPRSSSLASPGRDNPFDISRFRASGSQSVKTAADATKDMILNARETIQRLQAEVAAEKAKRIAVQE